MHEDHSVKPLQRSVAAQKVSFYIRRGKAVDAFPFVYTRADSTSTRHAFARTSARASADGRPSSFQLEP